VVKPSKHRVTDDPSSAFHLAAWSEFWRIWNPLAKTLVRPSVVKVRDIVGHHSVQVALIENEHMVQAFPPDTPDEAFHDGVGARCPHGCPEHLNLPVLRHARGMLV